MGARELMPGRRAARMRRASLQGRTGGVPGSGSRVAIAAARIAGPSVDQLLARDRYSPVRVSTRITSPSLMNSGTRTTAPVSSLAGF